MAQRVAIVGLGVMGGSLARALAAQDSPPVVVGWDRDPRQRDAAREAGVLTDETPGSVAAVAEGADVVVVATPLGTLEGVLCRVASCAGEALVMDVASLQAPALAAALTGGTAPRHVSAHPLTGSERSGFSGARADLYRGAPVSLSIDADATGAEGAALLARAEAFWRAVGARPVIEEAAVHDRRMVLASHLPQVVANVLAAVVADGGLAASDLGPGGRDTTRLAGSDPAMWRDLLVHSGPQVAEALRAVAGLGERLAEGLAAGEVERMEELMNQTRAWRNG